MRESHGISAGVSKDSAMGITKGVIEEASAYNTKLRVKGAVS
jgi:hypothetical protein